MPRQKEKIWDYFELINTDGKKTARCIFCRKHLGLNATKLKSHCVIACKQCPDDVKITLRGKSTTEKSLSPSVAPTQVSVPLPTPIPSRGEHSLPSTSSSSLSTKESSNRPQPEISLTPEQKKEIDLHFARAIYATGTPLNILESSLWQKAITALNSAYSVPSRYMISNTLLNYEYERVHKEITDIINQAEALALVMDGWTDINGKGTVNFIITTPKPFFYKCMYPGTNHETAAYLFIQSKSIIDEVGPAKFVAVVTDNANTMKAMWRMIEAEYPHVFAVGCASHTMSLLLKQIMKIQNIKTCNEIITKIIKYIKKRHIVLAYFEKIQNEKYGNNSRTLKLPSQTRWGGFIIMMESFLNNREALEAMAICHDLNIDRDIKQHLLTEELWVMANAYHSILSPILAATTKLESDSAVLSEVPQLFDSIKENVFNALSTCDILTTEEESYIMEAIRTKQYFVEKPIHFAANILDPRFRGLKLTPEKISKGQEFINVYAESKGINTAKVMGNLAEYRAKSGFYSQTGIWAAADEVNPRTWWKGLCNCQILSSIARKLLSVPPSSASSERNWSIFGNTLTRTRNRITTDRLQKLITVRANIKLLSNNPNESVQTIDDEEYISSNSSSEEENEDELDRPQRHFNTTESETSDGNYPDNDPLHF